MDIDSSRSWRFYFSSEQIVVITVIFFSINYDTVYTGRWEIVGFYKIREVIPAPRIAV